MKKEKFISAVLIILFIFTGSLFAQQADNSPEQTNPEKTEKKEEAPEKKPVSFDDVMDAIWPWPILSLETGYPELFSFDIGIETLFIPVGHEDRAGLYFCYSYGKSKNDSFHRFSTGVAYGFMGLFDARVGLGVGLMPKNDDTLHTFFIETSFRLFILEIKAVYERPRNPDYLVQYYNSTYDNGLKFKIGISL